MNLSAENEKSALKGARKGFSAEDGWLIYFFSRNILKECG